MKNNPPVAKRQRSFSIHQPGSDISENFGNPTNNNNVKPFVSNTGMLKTVEKLDDLEKSWTIATSNL